jgi:hypothetical protein
MSEFQESSEKAAAQSVEVTRLVEKRIDAAADIQPSARYLDAARAGAVEHPNHAIKAQGRAGERVALQEIESNGRQAVDLNERGANFPIYDVGERSGVASVKVRGLEDGRELSRVTKEQYARDLEEAIGRGSGQLEPALGDARDSNLSQAKFNHAAKYLNERAQAGDALPPELARSPVKAADYLRDHAELKIPADHAQQMRAYLREQLSGSDAVTRQVRAERLGLDLHAPNYQAQVEAMLNRVKPLPITAEQLRSVTPRQLTP